MNFLSTAVKIKVFVVIIMLRMIKFFSPGSITLFFEIKDQHPEPVKNGSRGVGIVIDLGSMTTVYKSDVISVSLNGTEMKNSIQHTILKHLKLKAKISTETQLPIQQGFGMSASAAVSTVLALNKQYGLNMSYYEALQIAHVSEIENRTGLGDVASQTVGGVTVRLKEGALPFGVVDKLIESETLVLLTLDKTLSTKKIITDPAFRKKINSQGRRALSIFLKDRTLVNAFDLGFKFSKSTGLLNEELEEIIRKSERFGKATMSLIGNSIVAYGDIQSLQDLFERYGSVFLTRVYDAHPKIIQ